MLFREVFPTAHGELVGTSYVRANKALESNALPKYFSHAGAMLTADGTTAVCEYRRGSETDQPPRE